MSVSLPTIDAMDRHIAALRRIVASNESLCLAEAARAQIILRQLRAESGGGR